MSKPFRARYRTTTWPEYNAAFRRRGFLLVFLEFMIEQYAEIDRVKIVRDFAS